ncbi:MAG: filamentous hemagglutinin N-terminal domain-containing protein [Microcoleaceae cyanobacterium]
MLSKFVFSTAVVGTTLIFPTISIQAQIIPDNSLGSESSVVVPNVNINNINSDRIDGGAIRGANLFHSFQEFNIDNGRGAYFSNPENISNILTRVTGSNISNIFGTLGVLGNANLFLINPNGIVFGPNARLDVGGSFFASTADSILFENSVEFAASNPDAPPLLTINIPIGLNFRENPGSIINQAALITTEDGSPLRDNNGFLIPQGLNVPQNQTLALVGGDVLFDNGVAISPGSNIELGGLSEPGIVEFNTVGANSNTPILQFPTNIQQADIILTNESQINVRADNGGDININAGNFEMSGGSIIRAGIDVGLGSLEAQAGDVNINAQNNIFLEEVSNISNAINVNGAGKSGKIEINASNSVELSGQSTINAATLGSGDAGTVNVTTRRLSVLDGAIIAVVTSGEDSGNTGQVEINASDSVELSGQGSSISIIVNGSGDVGNISIITKQLSVLEGSNVLAGTLENSSGNAGQVEINASDSVELSGQSFIRAATLGSGDAGTVNVTTRQLSVLEESSVSAGTLENSSGNAGQVEINASDSVELSGQSGIGAATLGSGDAGTVNITTRQLSVLDGAVIGVATSGEGSGNAGQVEINASDSVELSGQSFITAATLGSGDAGTVNVITRQLGVLDGASVSVGTFDKNGGDAGQIQINAFEFVELRGRLEDLRVSTTESESVELAGFPQGLIAFTRGSGNAGNISITTEQLHIRDSALISVNSESSGIPGNINIGANETFLRNQSFLNASSETGQGGNINLQSNDVRLLNRSGILATGSESGQTFEGNIEIDADLLVLLGGSGIITNAFSPSGGSNINIRPFNDSNSVNSSIGILQSTDSIISAAGNLTIDSSVIFQPAEIPEVAVTDPNDLIAAEFCRQRGSSAFVVTGRGGIAVNPNDKSDGSQINVDLVEPVVRRPQNTSQNSSEINHNQPISSLDIIPARGWIKDENGDVILVSYDPTKTAINRQPAQLPHCQSE